MKLEDTIRGFQEILEGKHDELPEQAFYMVGTIEQAVEKAAEKQAVAREPEPAGAKPHGRRPSVDVSLVTSP